MQLCIGRLPWLHTASIIRFYSQVAFALALLRQFLLVLAPRTPLLLLLHGRPAAETLSEGHRRRHPVDTADDDDDEHLLYALPK